MAEPRMSELGNSAELESELIRRNREIAKVRDEVMKAEKRLEESTLRNDELLEKNAELDTEVNTSRATISNMEAKSVLLAAKLEDQSRQNEELRAEFKRDFEVQATKLAAQHSADCARLNAEVQNATALLEEQKRISSDLDKDLKERNREIALLREESALLKEDIEEMRKDTSAKLESDAEAEKLRAMLQAKDNEMQSEMEVLRAKLNAQHQVEFAKVNAELHSVNALLEEHRRLKEDLEHQIDERERKLVTLNRDLEDTRRVESTRAAHDAQETQKRITELEAELAAAKAGREEGETKLHSLGVKNAQLERDMRCAHERVVEVEGRLDTQRQYVEQLTSSLSRAQGETDALRETKGSLEARLNEQSSSVQQQQDESTRRCRELEERVAHDRDNHARAMAEARQRIANLEADLAAKRQQSEATERSLTVAREAETKARDRETTWQRTEAELRSFVDTWRREAKDAQAELAKTKTQLEAEAAKWQAAMANEVAVVREEARAESAKVRRAWDELRNMVRAQVAAQADAAPGGGGVGGAGYGLMQRTALGTM